MKIRSLTRFYLIWQILILFIVSWAKNIFPLQTGFLSSNIRTYLLNPELYFRGNFDGIHYINIAMRGIGFHEEDFFPLYPKLISFLYPYIHNTLLTGTLISSGFFFLGLIYFIKLIRLDYKPEIAKWSVISMLFFPTSFFFASVYTEGLYFFLSVSSFYLARTKKWWLAAIFVALATQTKFIGIFLIPALFLELLAQKPKNIFLSLLPFLIMPLGLLSFMLQLKNIKGDPLALFYGPKSFKQGREHKIILPYQVIYRYGRMLTTVGFQNPLYYTLILESFIAISFITIGVILVFKSRSSYAFYALSTLILPTLTGTFTSMPRYALVCFPVFIFLGKYFAFHKPARILYLVASVVLSILFLALFSRGFWVA